MRAGRANELLVHRHVVARHPLDRESLFEHPPAAAAIEMRGLADGCRRGFNAVDDKPRDALVDDLGHRAARHAITGVPQAMASIITSPNGSGQSIGKSSAVAPPSSSFFSSSPTSPT